jgi:hypothetical protein
MEKNGTKAITARPIHVYLVSAAGARDGLIKRGDGSFDIWD